MQTKKIIPLMCFVGVCLAAGITLIWLLMDPIPSEAYGMHPMPIVHGEIIIEETVVLEQEAPLKSEDELMAAVVMAEAGNEPFVGKIAVASVILNRSEKWDKTIYEVLTAPNQFASPAYIVNEECYKAVEFARENRDLFPDDMLWFRTTKYHRYGEPYAVIGSHYFNTEESH